MKPHSLCNAIYQNDILKISLVETLLRGPLKGCSPTCWWQTSQVTGSRGMLAVVWAKEGSFFISFPDAVDFFFSLELLRG